MFYGFPLKFRKGSEKSSSVLVKHNFKMHGFAIIFSPCLGYYANCVCKMKENAVESDSHNHIYLKSHEEKQISEGENQNGKKILPMHTTEIHYFQIYVPSQEKGQILFFNLRI